GGLGFRDFRALNQALLAKQGWWLLKDPSSLAARVLKGRYYPHSSFLKINPNCQGSWIWKSILYGRDLLLSGIGWQLGDGSSFNFLDDNWLFPNGPNKVLLKASAPLPIPNLPFFQKNGWWIKNCLEQYFDSSSVQENLQILIPPLPHQGFPCLGLH
ncbi:Uncharacterized mitochondrial protein AtMg00310, partial [Linum grandiflorum]